MSQITSLTIVCSTVYSVANQIKHQSYASLASVRRIHRSPVNSPHKGRVSRKMFPFDDVIMRMISYRTSIWPCCPWFSNMTISIGGLNSYEISMLKSMLVNTNLQTSFLIGWQQIKSHVRKFPICIYICGFLRKFLANQALVGRFQYRSLHYFPVLPAVQISKRCEYFETKLYCFETLRDLMVDIFLRAVGAPGFKS